MIKCEGVNLPHLYNTYYQKTYETQSFTISFFPFGF